MRKLIELERNSSGEVFIGLTVFSDDGVAVRSSVVSHGGKNVHDKVMLKRFNDLEAIARPEVDFAITYSFMKGYFSDV